MINLNKLRLIEVAYVDRRVTRDWLLVARESADRKGILNKARKIVPTKKGERKSGRGGGGERKERNSELHGVIENGLLVLESVNKE